MPPPSAIYICHWESVLNFYLIIFRSFRLVSFFIELVSLRVDQLLCIH